MMGFLLNAGATLKVLVVAAAVLVGGGLVFKTLHDAQRAGAYRQALETARDIAEANRKAGEAQQRVHRAALSAQGSLDAAVAAANAERDDALARIAALEAAQRARQETLQPCPENCLLPP